MQRRQRKKREKSSGKGGPAQAQRGLGAEGTRSFLKSARCRSVQDFLELSPTRRSLRLRVSAVKNSLRRYFGVFTVMRHLTLTLLFCAALSAADKPNIIFILADDMGYGDLGCYGQTKIKTPNIDKLATEGMKFTQCYAGNTVCAPSRCALMTGKHMGHAFVRGNADVALPPNEITIAKILKDAGYATANIGKWGLGDPGTIGVATKHGFDEFFGYLNQVHAHNYYPDHLFRNEERYEIPENKDGMHAVYTHDLFTKEALSFIERKKDQPFFLYLAYTIPHGNNEAIKADGMGMQVPSDEPYTKEDWPQQEKNFAAMVSRLDRDVGTLMAKLKELGLDEKTLVFFTSDNGPTAEGHDPKFFKSGGPLKGIKRDLYEGGIREPMLARWPGKIKAGAVSEQVWAFWDFLPTAAEICGGKIPDGLDGISMKNALLGIGEQKNHEYLYWEFHERGFTQAVRFGDWKAVRNVHGKPIELYDLARDVGEITNLAQDHADLIAKAEELFKSARVDSKEFPIKEPKKK
jgi:arylsulfatase A-like enzyme